MYVCVCKAVTDKRIRQAVSEGACTLRDLRLRYGLGTGCGKCVPQAHGVLSEALRHVPHASVEMVQIPRAGNG